MGVFYNPSGPMPIAQMGFQSPPLSSSSGGMSKQQKQRDLHAEFRDAQVRANQRSGGDPLLYKQELISEGYPLEAQQFGEQYAKTKDADIKVQELETQRSIENIRMASDLTRAGREDLALKVANKDATPETGFYTALKYNPKDDTVNYQLSTGENGTQKVDDIIKAATKSETQFKEQATTERLRIQLLRDRQKLSPTDLTGIAYQKQMAMENYMRQGQTSDQVAKAHPELVLLPTEKELIAKHAEGDFGPIAAAIYSANPKLFETYGAKTADDAIKMMADIYTKTREELGARRTARQGPKIGEEVAPGTPVSPVTGTERNRTTISIGGKQHPAFVDKSGGVRMISPDGKTGVVPQDKVEQAVKDGFKLQ